MAVVWEWRAELAARRSQLWSIVQKAQCDVGLVYGTCGHSEAFRYLTRFVAVLGDNWGVLGGDDRLACVLNFHWQLAEARELSGIDGWHGAFEPIPCVLETLAVHRPRRIAVFGLRRIPYVAVKAIEEAFPEVVLVNTSPEFDHMRRVKSPLEVHLLREAVHVTDNAIDAVRSELQAGQTEIEIAARLTYLMHRQGADLAFAGAVMSGNDRDDIIRAPSSRRVEPGETLMFDVGAAVEGYNADVGRTFVLGRPSELQQKAWDAVRRTHDSLVAMIAPGIPCRTLHETAVRVMGNAGFTLRHRIGHGIGLATSFEWPSLDTEPALLQPGMTLAIEPAVYGRGAGAVKLENDVLVTEAGCELLSRCSTEWIV